MGNFDECEAVPGSGRLLNPLGGLVIPAGGKAPFSIVTPPPPSVSSAECAAEYAELLGMALLRDVPFSEYGENEEVADVAQALSLMVTDKEHNDMWWRPVSNTEIDPAQQLFRMDIDGCTRGPMVSQILLEEFMYDGIQIEPKIQTQNASTAYMTNFTEWLKVQNGEVGFVGQDDNDPVHRYPRNARDLGVIAMRDRISSVYMRATFVRDMIPFGSGFYGKSHRQFGFASAGGFARRNEQVVASIASETHAWFCKWNVHRFLRPEAFGGLAHLSMTKTRDYPIHESLFNSALMQKTFEKWGSYFLPQINARGGPSHPSYPSGHAISAGAAVTVLKVYADPDANRCYPNTIRQPTSDGLNLEEVPNSKEFENDKCLTVNGELNKLAANLATGRDMSGVHWRADGVAGMLQGEEVAIAYLQDEVDRAPECQVLRFNSFEGDFVMITPEIRHDCD